MTGGATNPDIQDALDAVVADQYEIIVTPFNNQTDLGTLTDHLDLVSGPMEQRPGVGAYGMNGALGTATTLSGQVNHGRVLCVYLRYTDATMEKSMPYEIASAMAAIMAWEEDPARPLNTLELKGIAVANINDRLSRTEQESLLYNGVTPLEIGPGETVQVVRAISTYIEDAQGIPDISLLDITTIRTLDYVRKACRERIALRFPREKLSSKTPPKVKSELYDVLLKLEDLEIVENVADNKDGLIVERDDQDPNRLDAKIPADVVNGLHVFAGRIDLLL
jgi:phage tail sheath gpL-like